jgi:gluconolactonase
MKTGKYLFLLFVFLLLTRNCFAAGNDSLTVVPFDTVVTGLNFPEGPAWDGNNSLYLSNCYGGYITRISGDSSSEFIRASENPRTINKTNGLTFGKDGCLYACEFGDGNILKISPGGTVEVYASGFEGKRFSKPNDLAFDQEGNLFFTDTKSYDRNNRDGIVYRIDAKDKSVSVAADDLAFPNGIAFSEDGKYAFVCESAFNRVDKFKIDIDGKFFDKEVFAELPGGDPDGLAFDSAGNLYIAHFGGGKIYVFNKSGSAIKVIKTPGKKPSNLEFGGKDLKTLFITEGETNSVYKIINNIPGMKLFYAP